MKSNTPTKPVHANTPDVHNELSEDVCHVCFMPILKGQTYVHLPDSRIKVHSEHVDRKGSLKLSCAKVIAKHSEPYDFISFCAPGPYNALYTVLEECFVTRIHLELCRVCTHKPPDRPICSQLGCNTTVDLASRLVGWLAENSETERPRGQ